VNCTTVRDLLAERALGVASARERSVVERHLAWCAPCRKEAADLDRAASTLAFALAPSAPAPELEARVVASIREAVTPHMVLDPPEPDPPELEPIRSDPSERPRRRPARRRALAVLLAATLALGVTGAGTVLALRLDRPDPAVLGERQQRALEDFVKVFTTGPFVDAESVVLLGSLDDANGGHASGSAMVILSPTQDDQVLVNGSGLRGRARNLPYSVRLASGSGDILRVGYLASVAPGGSFTVARAMDTDLSGYVNVTVRDAHNRVVMTGTLRQEASVTPGA
jgi:Putative zinc-finger